MFQWKLIRDPPPSLKQSHISALSPSLDARITPDHQPVPVFDAAQSGNVTAILGQTAILNCRVGGVGSRTVSWVRQADTHLLAVGLYTYTSDMRFRASHNVQSEDYSLQISSVQVRVVRLY